MEKLQNGLLKAKLSCSDGGSYRVLKKVLELRRDGREAMPIKASRGKKDFSHQNCDFA